jgi:hypothetical protein
MTRTGILAPFRVQDDQLRSREDLCDLLNRDDEKKPAEAAGANDDHVRSIAAGRVPHLLDNANPTVRRVDAKTLAASKPVVEVSSSAARTLRAGSHRPPFRVGSTRAQPRSRSAKSGLPSLDDYFSLWRFLS